MQTDPKFPNIMDLLQREHFGRNRRAITATAVFGKMRKNKCISLKVKMGLYEAIVLSTLLYSAEVWPLTATLTDKLNAARHRWHR